MNSPNDKAVITKLRQEENSAFRQWQDARRILENAERDEAETKDVYFRRRTFRRTAQWQAGADNGGDQS